MILAKLSAFAVLLPFVDALFISAPLAINASHPIPIQCYIDATDPPIASFFFQWANGFDLLEDNVPLADSMSLNGTYPSNIVGNVVAVKYGRIGDYVPLAETMLFQVSG